MRAINALRGQEESEEFDRVQGSDRALSATRKLLGDTWGFQGAQTIRRVDGEPQALLLEEVVTPPNEFRRAFRKIDLLVGPAGPRWVQSQPGPTGQVIRHELSDHDVATAVSFASNRSVTASDLEAIRVGLAGATVTALESVWEPFTDDEIRAELVNLRRELPRERLARAARSLDAVTEADPGHATEWEANWKPLPVVPADIAEWSPRVNSLASQALHGGLSLNALPDDSKTQHDRDELRLAFQQMTNRMNGLSAPVTVEVGGAQESLQSDDLDATLRHLVTADQLHQGGNHLPEPATESSSLVRSTEVGSEQQTAVSNALRSDMTAAAEIHAQARSEHARGETGAAAAPLREKEAEILARIDAAEEELVRSLGGRPDVHRRPERAVENQSLGREQGRSVDGSD